MNHRSCHGPDLQRSISLGMLALLLMITMLLAGCVTREIKEDPWTSPRGSVDMRKYDATSDPAKPQVLSPTGRSSRP